MATARCIASNRIHHSFQAKDQWATQPIWSLDADAEGSVWCRDIPGRAAAFPGQPFCSVHDQRWLADDVICQFWTMAKAGCGSLAAGHF